MNQKKVPQLFVATGASKWGNPKEFPWTMGWQPDYATEGAIYAKHILATVKDAKIGVLMQNDDYGKDYFNGFKAGLGKDADKIVQLATYEVTDPDRRQPDDPAQELRRQRVLQHHDAQVRGAGDQEGGRDRLEAGALPQQRVVLVRRGDEAGRPRERRRASSSRSTSRTPTDPQWANAPDIIAWKAFMAKYMPQARPRRRRRTYYGYAVASTLIQVLKQCGDDLTRENVMKQAASLKGFEIPMLLPGIKVNTSATDFYPIQAVRLARVQGRELGAVRRRDLQRERKPITAHAGGRRAVRRPQSNRR